MLNKFWFILLLSFIDSLNIHAQITEWSFQPAVSIYHTPLKINRYSISSGINPDEKYFENTTNFSLSLPLNAKLRIGVQLNMIANKVIREPIDRSYLLGTSFQYNFRAQRKLGIYLESGYAFGRFCPCGEQEAFTGENFNHFLQMGLGLNFKLIKQLHIKTGFLNYHPIKGHSEIYNWTQPFIGAKFFFYKNYQVPFKSKFLKRTKVIPKEARDFYWVDEHKRKWNIGLSSSGIAITQHNSLSGQVAPLRRYREFTIVPRINYWLNQAILLGVQGTYYHYEDNYDNDTPKSNGFGLGLQSRFYPLSLNNPNEFRAIRIGKRGNWNVSPVVGVEAHVANYSWTALPQTNNKKWEYFDIQPYLGIVLSFKHSFNLFWNLGPTLGNQDSERSSPVSGVRIFGLEYNFSNSSEGRVEKGE